MSPRGLPRRTLLSRPAPREGENPVGAIRRIWLVGKQTTISNRNTLAATSFLAEWSPRFVLFYSASPAPCLAREAGCLGRSRYAGQTRSAVQRLLTSTSNAIPLRFLHKPFSLHDLPSVVRRRGLTARSQKRYTAILRGRSRRGGLTESPNGPVA